MSSLVIGGEKSVRGDHLIECKVSYLAAVTTRKESTTTALISYRCTTVRICNEQGISIERTLTGVHIHEIRPSAPRPLYEPKLKRRGVLHFSTRYSAGVRRNDALKK